MKRLIEQMYQKAYWKKDSGLKREIEKNLDVLNHCLCTVIQNIQKTYINNASHSETSGAHSYTSTSLVHSVHVHGPFVDPKVRVTYSTQCKTIIYFRAALNIESVPGLLLCDSAAGTSHGNPTCCVFLTHEGFIIRECISISLLPPSGSDGNSSTSGPHLYSSGAAVPLPLSTVQLFFINEQAPPSTHILSSSGKGNHTPVQMHMRFFRSS